MAEVGRRGAISVIYEVIISLVLLGLFILFVFTYINANATGAQYFSKFYAVDLATSADLVLAGNGDVVLRYDHMKPELDLTLWLTNGKVAVAPSPEWNTTFKFGFGRTQETSSISFFEPPYAEKQYYGRARSYPKPDVFFNPEFLALRKVGRSFSITQGDIGVEACPGDEPGLRLEDAVIHLEVDGLTETGSSRIRDAFTEIIDETSLVLTPDKERGTVLLSVKRETGEANSLTIGPTNDDGLRYACLFENNLELLSFTEFMRNTPSSSGNDFTVPITIRTNTTAQVLPEHVGRALAYAIARFYG